MWNLALKNIKEIRRDKKVLVTSLVFPILLFLISRFLLHHTTFFTENLPLAVVNPEPAFPQAGKLLVLSLKRAVSSNLGHPLYAIEEAGRKDALRKLRESKVAGVLLIPRGFSDKLRLKKPEKLALILNDADPRAPVLSASIHAFIEHFGLLVKQSQGVRIESPISLSTVKQGQGKLPPEYESLARVTLFAFLFLIPFAAGQWVSEIERGSWTRFLLSQTSPGQIFGGILISTTFLGLIQAALLIVAAFLAGIRPYLLVVWIWPLAFILVLASMGVGLMLSSFAETEKQLNLFSSLLIVPLFLVSGSFGRALAATRWITVLPWNQGYSLLGDVLGYHSPGFRPVAEITASSLVLAILGTLIFSSRRFQV